jgi:hypothetical protein
MPVKGKGHGAAGVLFKKSDNASTEIAFIPYNFSVLGCGEIEST